MIEPITEEKLREYGFDDLMIERLKTWEDYECKMTNGTDFFYASNITGLIYTGEDGYDKFRNIGIGRFKTFDDMFQRAVEMKSIDLYTDPNLSASYKLALYQTDRSIYNSDFNAWLQKFKNWEYGNEPQYREFLTKEVWIEFLAYRQNQKEERLKRHETEKASWQITDKQPEAKENIKHKAVVEMEKQLKRIQPHPAILRQINLLQTFSPAEPEEKKSFLSLDIAKINKQKSDEDRLIDRLIERLHQGIIETKPVAVVNIEQTQQTENNFLHSTIEDWLYPFKEENRMSETDYNILVSALKHYFETGSFPTLSQKIQVGSVNKKRFGWALNQIYRTAKSGALPLDYLVFAKENISLFERVAFTQSNYTKSNFYKYFTTETK